MKPEPYLTAADLAEILRVSPKTIQNRLAEHPDTLPPRSSLPGTKGALWRVQVVNAWLNQYDPPSLTEATSKRRVGRPTKAEQVRTRLAQSGAA